MGVCVFGGGTADSDPPQRELILTAKAFTGFTTQSTVDRSRSSTETRPRCFGPAVGTLGKNNVSSLSSFSRSRASPLWRPTGRYWSCWRDRRPGRTRSEGQTVRPCSGMRGFVKGPWWRRHHHVGPQGATEPTLSRSSF